MFPPSPGVAVLFDADYAGIQAPRIIEQIGSASPLLCHFANYLAELFAHYLA